MIFLQKYTYIGVIGLGIETVFYMCIFFSFVWEVLEDVGQYSSFSDFDEVEELKRLEIIVILIGWSKSSILV